MAVWTYDFVSLFSQSHGFLLRECRNPDLHLHRNAAASCFARPDRGGACDDSPPDILLMLPCHEFDRASETRCVPRCKQVLWRGGVGQSRSTHLLPDRQVDADGAIGGLRMSVPSSGVDGDRRDERFDCVSSHDPLLSSAASNEKVLMHFLEQQMVVLVVDIDSDEDRPRYFKCIAQLVANLIRGIDKQTLGAKGFSIFDNIDGAKIHAR